MFDDPSSRESLESFSPCLVPDVAWPVLVDPGAIRKRKNFQNTFGEISNGKNVLASTEVRQN